MPSARFPPVINNLIIKHLGFDPASQDDRDLFAFINTEFEFLRKHIAKHYCVWILVHPHHDTNTFEESDSLKHLAMCTDSVYVISTTLETANYYFKKPFGAPTVLVYDINNNLGYQLPNGLRMSVYLEDFIVDLFLSKKRPSNVYSLSLDPPNRVHRDYDVNFIMGAAINHYCTRPEVEKISATVAFANVENDSFVTKYTKDVERQKKIRRAGLKLKLKLGSCISAYRYRFLIQIGKEDYLKSKEIPYKHFTHTDAYTFHRFKQYHKITELLASEKVGFW